MQVNGELHAPGRFTSRYRTRWTGGWVGPRAGLDVTITTELSKLPIVILSLSLSLSPVAPSLEQRASMECLV
jgi:hypothetical protein